MVKFKQIYFKDGFYKYEIYPEGDMNDVGVIIFNPDTNEIQNKQIPKAGENYFYKAISGLTDEKGNFKESGMVAWY